MMIQGYRSLQLKYVLLLLVISAILLSAALTGCTKHAKDTSTEPAVNTLSAEEIESLGLAINDEYKARATYQKVIDKFGEVRPFSNIVQSEEQHIQALEDIYAKNGLTAPEDDWYDKVPEFNSVKAACDAGVQAEIANVALYDGLLPKVQNNQMKSTFNSLRTASNTKHLPAFEWCG